MRRELKMEDHTNNRMRILAIERMLSTDVTSAKTIIKRLKEQYHITVERKTVYKDMQVLMMFMPNLKKKGNEGWYLDSEKCYEKNDISLLFKNIIEITKGGNNDILFHQSNFGLEVIETNNQKLRRIARVITDISNPEDELNFHLPLMNKELNGYVKKS